MKKNIKKRNILVVDDNEIDRGVLKSLLIKNNYQVLDTDNGIDALYMLKHSNIDVLITDILMPEMNGVEVINILQSRLVKKPIIFILSSSADFFSKELNRLSAIDKVFTKPVDQRRLLKNIQFYLDVPNIL